MNVRTPLSKFDLRIKKKYNVLEVGSGHNPHPLSHTIVDKFLDDNNTHRSGKIKIFKNQKFLKADGEQLPFNNNEFDYSLCIHVLEHVENPDKFLSEQMRVAKRGYIETPSIIGEHLHPKESHKWVILNIDNTLILYDKHSIGFHTSCDFNELFLSYLKKNSLAFKFLEITRPTLRRVQLEWENNINYKINPDDKQIMGYFNKPWNKDIIEYFFPSKSIFHDLKAIHKFMMVELIANRGQGSRGKFFKSLLYQ